MALDFKSGGFTVSTGTAGTKQTISGLSFYPEVVLFMWNGRTETSDTYGRMSLQQGFGMYMFTAPTLKQSVSSMRSEDNLTTSDSGAGHRNDAVIAVLDTSDAWNGRASIDAVLADGFRLNIDQQFPSGIRIDYLAFGGTDLQALDITEVVEPAATGSQTISGPGFQPDLLIAISSPKSGASPQAGAGGRNMIGCAVNHPSGVKQYVWAAGSADAVTTTAAMKYSNSTDFLAHFNTGVTALDRLASVTSFNANGYVLNWSKVTGAGTTRYYVVAIKGGNWDLGSITTVNSTSTDLTITGLAFQPKGALFISGTSSETAHDTPSNQAKFSVGLFSGVSDQESMYQRDNNGLTTTQVTVGVEYDGNFANGDASVNRSTMSVKSVQSDGLTCRMDLAEAQAHFVEVLTGGNGQTNSGNIGQPISRRHMGVWPQNPSHSVGM